MKKIKEKPNWKYAGCYVDDGFSGTDTDHRQGFQKLMKDAIDGKIDMIITKAVSRFARNLMDCIGWVEALQNHDPPVRVFFEQENLDTMSQTSGIILFVLAMVAQEESHILDEELIADLGSEYLPEGGHRIGGLVDDHGIAQIARDLTAAEQEIKDELEGRTAEKAEKISREEAAKAFQVVSGDMFSRVLDPVIRITTKGITFNRSCVSKLTRVEYAELLFNPVERMLVVRQCFRDNPNAVAWDASYKSAAPMCKVLYDSMGWATDYSFRVPCQKVDAPDGHGAVLVFDLDNYIGRASDKKDEVIIAKKETAEAREQRDDAKSYYYPPDEDEPEEIRDMEERFTQAVEMNRRFFGTPVFMHESGLRGISSIARTASGT